MGSEPTSAPQTSWADDEGDFLPDEAMRFETPVDERGFKTITEITFRDKKKFKITTKVRVVKKVKKINIFAEERQKNWKKFGKATINDPSITVVERDNVPFDISGRKKKLVEKKVEQEIENMLRNSRARNEGVAPSDAFKAKSLRPGGARPTETVEEPKEKEEAKNTYKPPSKRDGAKETAGRSMFRAGGGEETYTVRVTNLAAEITDQDLRDLFGAYGSLQRVSLVRDPLTRESRGLAFIDFLVKEDAAKAIEKVDGFGFNHLILHVDWSKKKER